MSGISQRKSRESLEAEIKVYQEKNKWVARTMGTLSRKVDAMLEEIGAKADVSQCQNNGYYEMGVKLDVLQKFVNMNEGLKKLDGLKQTYQEACSTSQPMSSEGEVKEEDFSEAFRKCRSIKDIENKFPEFRYNIEAEMMKCEVCGKLVSSYKANLEHDFSGKVLSDKFRNLKKILSEHLGSENHLKLIQSKEVCERLEEKIEGREKKIGKVLGCVAYYLIRQGRPNTDFPLLVNILAVAGVDVGDLNHSSEFVANWGPVCAGVIERKLKCHLNTPMQQTGQLPPVKGVADKATWQHFTRMISGLVTVVPDSECLIQAFLTGTELCPHGSGTDMTQSLTKVWDKFFVSSQYHGLAADGATLHCNVGRELGKHFQRKVHDDYDPLHKAGLVDIHMRAPGAGVKFKFLKDITDLISSVNTFFNMGMEFSRLLEIVKELEEEGIDIKMKLPRFFSDTRFANYVALIYSGVVDNYPAIIRALTQVQEEGSAPGASDSQRKKADRCAGIQAKLYSLRCALTVCGLRDVYSNFSKTVCVLQEVNVLPHVKYDRFETGCRQWFEDMKNNIQLASCCCSRLTWPELPQASVGAEAETCHWYNSVQIYSLFFD